MIKKIFLIASIMSLLFAGVNQPQKQDIVITLSGELDSKSPTYINAPESWNVDYQILHLPPEGQWVETGDTVVIFDTKEIEQNLDEINQNYEQIEKQLEQTLLTNELSISDIKNQIKSLKIQRQIAITNLEQSKYNSQTDQKDAELELKKVNLNIQKTQRALESQKILNRNSENELELQKEQYYKRILDYKKLMQNMYLTAPKDGIVVYHRQGRRGRGDKVKIGDSVRPTSTILQIPDLDDMIVKIDLNEVDISKVKLGQKAAVEVLAFPDTTFSGTVDYIAKIAEETDDSNLRIYPVDIKLNSKRDTRLKPGLTVKVRLTIQNFEEGFAIPSWCLFQEQEKFYVIANDQKISVELIKNYDGRAYVKGPLETTMELAENQEIPKF